MTALAQLGDGPVRRSDIVAALGLTSTQVSKQRDSLLKQGLIRSLDYGFPEFTIPGMTSYLGFGPTQARVRRAVSGGSHGPVRKCRHRSPSSQRLCWNETTHISRSSVGLRQRGRLRVIAGVDAIAVAGAAAGCTFRWSKKREDRSTVVTRWVKGLSRSWSRR